MGAFIASTSIFVLVLIFGGIALVHFLPVFIAGARHVSNFWWIVLINVLFGWTLIGWVVALVWALKDDPKWTASYMPPPNSRY
ncbi:MAG: superinfection immunity protein [Acidobacteriota bacterium]|nr:superinfection immunity protein [Acidobacteriota bacterium]